MTKIATAIALASLAATFAGSTAQAGWGPNGMYGNAPQGNVPQSNAPQPRPGFGGYGGNGSTSVVRPNVVNPAQRPAWIPPTQQPSQAQQVYPRPAPPPVYIPTAQQVYPRPAPPPVYIPTPVVVRQPVYVPTPPVVKETVYVQRPATTTVVAAAPAQVVTPAPVVSNTCNCLVKEYPQAGVVVFRDVCTKESATYSNLPQQTAVLPPQ
ncbi:hypothetical protein [Bradyrhizobium sp. 21]|uniref:hypothetical protein n=1 Tax=Bradyrhizobium sp. 21 TaxID=2782666 RepID=UPI001FF76B68|nr:hypothetical protein [Bradyrhizobium sp. 21]MCK1387671.1 hypothetical protein [Bradyrhizobium sp. 21]